VTTRILIADDHALVREGLRLILETHSDLEVVGETGSGRETIELVRRLAPDLVLMDIAMPELNGIEATAMLKEGYPAVRVVVLSMHATSEHIYRAFQAGASGYLVKESAGAEVVDAVRSVVLGGRYLSRKIAGTVIDDLTTNREVGRQRSPLESLSPREREILQLVAEGHSSVAIGKLVHLSPKTVDTYRSRLMKKLGVDDLAGLIRFALEHGLIGQS